MTGQEHALQELLRRRFDLVTGISALTARAHRLIQEMSGIEMEMLRLELATAREPDNGRLVQELHETEERAENTRSAQADCQEEIGALEAAVSEVDRLLAATKGGVS